MNNKDNRFLIRAARPADISDLLRLARLLDSYNLPADRRRLRRLIGDSALSFAGRPPSIARARYLFVLEDTAVRRVVGTSQIISKHGTPGLPHLYMTSFNEKRRSATLRKSVEHRCLRLGATEDGPTEVGGLVLLPAYRGRVEKLGLWLSYVRFLFIASHQDIFQKYLLAEYLPVFMKNGKSPFWEYFGKKFTGLSYREADRLSIDNKEFILSLFPRSTLYQDFFPPAINKYLGQVGDPSLPAARLLRKIGFTYLHQIEPFDGGPYHGALTRAVTVVMYARQLQAKQSPAAGSWKRFLIMGEGKSGPRAFAGRGREIGTSLQLSPETMKFLSLEDGDWLWAYPLFREER